MKYSIIKYSIIAACAIILSACQTGKPIAMSVVATPTAKSIANGDVLGPQRAAGQDVPQLQGQEVVTVRTYEHRRDPDAVSSTRTELEGIACSLESDGYRAAVKTPAQVTVPDYGYASRPIRIQCNAPGFKTGVATVQPYSKTSASRIGAARGAGLAAVLIVAVVDSATDPKKHDYGYEFANVTMNRTNCASTKAGCR